MKVYTIEECRTILRYESRTTIYDMIAAGVLKKTGRGRVQAASLDRFVESGMTWQEYAKTLRASTVTARTGSTKARGGTSTDSKDTPSQTATRNGQKLSLKLLKNV